MPGVPGFTARLSFGAFPCRLPAKLTSNEIIVLGSSKTHIKIQLFPVVFRVCIVFMGISRVKLSTLQAVNTVQMFFIYLFVVCCVVLCCVFYTAHCNYF